MRQRLIFSFYCQMCTSSWSFGSSYGFICWGFWDFCLWKGLFLKDSVVPNNRDENSRRRSHLKLGKTTELRRLFCKTTPRANPPRQKLRGPAAGSRPTSEPVRSGTPGPTIAGRCRPRPARGPGRRLLPFPRVTEKPTFMTAAVAACGLLVELCRVWFFFFCCFCFLFVFYC